MSVFRDSVLGSPLVFVDIETNGMSHLHGRVIEVAAIRVENGQVTGKFTSLIDPEAPLPSFITSLTGITNNDLASAPTFDQVADELMEVLSGAIFVAHNVRFDYSFLKQEFGRLGVSFAPKQLCTVKLSRALYPHERGHKLADLIARHNFSFTHRHRAYDDAAVLWQFLQHLDKHFPPEQVLQAVSAQLKQPALPKSLDPALVKNLPEGPGVYIFEDEAGRPLYVGKSVSIRKRVLSHFSRDHAEVKEFKIAQHIKHITTHETTGELAALLLESQLVKSLQPLYNRQLRQKQKLIIVRQAYNEQGYLTASLEEADRLEVADLGAVLAVYPRRSRARESLNELAKTYELCPKLLGLEKASGACFMYQLKKCHGACAGHEPAASYNQRLQLVFERQRIKAWPYQGPVLIEEKQTAQPGTHAMIIDQWCVVGEVDQQPYCEPTVKTQQASFDLDTYKILQLFLTSKIDKLKIKLLSYDQLNQLALSE